MRTTDRDIMELASQQRDLVSKAQLRRHGVGYERTGRLVGRGVMEEVYPTIWRVGSGPLTFEQRMVACCLAVPTGVLSHGTGGAEYGLRKAPRERLEITVGHNDWVGVPDVLVHRSNRLNPDDIVFRLDGSRVVTPERAAFDLAGVLDFPALLSLVHDGLKRELVSVESLAELAGRLAVRGRRGSQQFRRAVLALGGQVPAVDSDDELVLLRALEAAGLEPRHQLWVQLRSGAFVRLDIAFPDGWLAFEVDHSFWHTLPERVQADKARDLQVAQVGFTTHRVTEVDIRTRLRATVAAICDLYRQALARRRAA